MQRFFFLLRSLLLLDLAKSKKTVKAGFLLKRVNSIIYYAIAKADVDKDAKVPCPTCGSLRYGWRGEPGKIRNALGS